MNATQLAAALVAGELKTLQSVAKHIPKQDSSGVIGVTSGTAWQWIDRGNLPLEQVVIDTERFFYIPQADQLKADWGLQAKFKKRATRGRRSTAEVLGFAPKKG